MAKDASHTRIPRLDGVSRIPMPGSIRAPCQATNRAASKLGRPLSFSGPRPPTAASMLTLKKSLSGDRISDAANLVMKRPSAIVRRFLTKPEKSANNIEASAMGESSEKGIKETSNEKLVRSGTFVRDEPADTTQVLEDKSLCRTHTLDGSKIGVLGSTMTLDGKALNVTETLSGKSFALDNTNILGSTMTLDAKPLNATETLSGRTFTNSTHVLDNTKALGRTMDFTHVLDGTKVLGSSMDFPKGLDNTKVLGRTVDLGVGPGCGDTITLETSKPNELFDKTMSCENLIDVSLPALELDATLKAVPSESYQNLVNLTADLNDTITLAPDKRTMKLVLNSTMNTERLLDITATMSPGHLMNITRDVLDSPKEHAKNLTNLLYLTQAEVERSFLSPVLQGAKARATPDEPMEVEDLKKPRYSFGLDLTECTLDCSIELCDVSLTSSAPMQVSSPSLLRKQNSFEMDESLGILTPDQMKEFLDSTTNTNTNNLDLPLGMLPNGSGKMALHQMRIDQTPSPEELPLDPVGVKTDVSDLLLAMPPPPPQSSSEFSQTDSESKTDQMSKSKISTSFITSVTSVTSLDTGYQGDGEMSRPASRGAGEHSPNHRKSAQVSRQPSFNQNHVIPIRRQDPMTDSDFFTESDADDVFHRGDRRAQVIDGQLYGPMLHPTASVFITEQPQLEDSCMESSGIFTDVENRCDDDLAQRRSCEPQETDMSPDGSTDTVKSNNAQMHRSHTDADFPPAAMSQGHSTNNMLTDSQTSSTIQSSFSSDRISISTDYNPTSLKRNFNDAKSSMEALCSESALSAQAQPPISTTAAVSKLSPSGKHLSSSSLSSSLSVLHAGGAKNDKALNAKPSGNIGRAKVSISNRENNAEMLIKASNTDNQENRNPAARATSVTPAAIRKPSPNKWDAVMSKIAENKSHSKKNYNQVKSKVSTGVLRRSPPSGLSSGNNSVAGKSALQDRGSTGGATPSSSGLVSPQTKRVIQGATKRGRSYSKDSQQSSQSDLSLSGGSPKLLAKTPLRAAKKRDVRNLSISPSDLGPPPKAQQTTNGSVRIKPTSNNNVSQKRASPNLQSHLSSPVASVKGSTPSKKTVSRRTEQKSHGKTPLKDHNRLLSTQHPLQNGTAKSNGGVGSNTSVAAPKNGVPAASTPIALCGIVSNDKALIRGPQSPPSPILNNNNIGGGNATATLLQKKHQQQQQQLHTTQSRPSCNGRLEFQPSPNKSQIQSSKDVEALGVLLQYLVYDLDAFAAPSIKKQCEKAQSKITQTVLLLDEAKSACTELQDQMQERESYYITREQELQALHRCESKKFETLLFQARSNAKERIASLEAELQRKDDENKNKFSTYVSEVEVKLNLKENELQSALHRERELLERVSLLTNTENELREKVHAAECSFAERIQAACQREKDLVEKVNALNKQIGAIRTETENRQSELEDKLNLSQDELAVLRHSRSYSDANTSLSSQGSPRNSHNELQRLQNEAESLRCVLELKQKEISKLTKQNQELSRDAEEALALSGKVSTLENRVEYLDTKFQLKSDEEKTLREKYDALKKAMTHETTIRTRLSFDNEGLQYQLKQRSEQLHIVEAKLREQMSSSKISLSQDTSCELSHNSSLLNLNRTNGSDRIQFQMDDVSPPTSPVIKGVIEKHDSVSWVLEMDDETPEVAASKMVRRAGSFRSSLSEKSPGHRRQHSHSLNQSAPNPLTQSASATVIRQHSSDGAEARSNSRTRSKSVCVKNTEPKKLIRQSSTGSRRLDLAASWKEPVCASSPYQRSTSMRCRASPTASKQLARSLITCDTSALNSGEKLELRSLSTHPSMHDMKCQEILESAGEAMVSGTNSEDEGCSASSDDVGCSSSTASSSTSLDRKQHMSIEEVLQLEKISTRFNGTPMEVSWSDDPDQYGSESVV